MPMCVWRRRLHVSHSRTTHIHTCTHSFIEKIYIYIYAHSVDRSWYLREGKRERARVILVYDNTNEHSNTQLQRASACLLMAVPRGRTIRVLPARSTFRVSYGDPCARRALYTPCAVLNLKTETSCNNKRSMCVSSSFFLSMSMEGWRFVFSFGAAQN